MLSYISLCEVLFRYALSYFRLHQVLLSHIQLHLVTLEMFSHVELHLVSKNRCIKKTAEESR